MRRRLGPVLLLALVLAACTSDSPESDTGEGARVVGPGDVGVLENGTQVVTEGVLVISDVARLCETIMPAMPPQCDGGFVVLADLQPDTVVDLRSATDSQGITGQWTGYPYAVSGTVDNGTLINVEGFDRVYPAVEGGLRLRLVAAQSPIFPQQLRSGEAIWFAIDAMNLTDQAIPMTFNNGQVAEVTLSRGDEEVYRWSTDRTFTQAINQIDFGGGEIAGATLRDDLFVVDPGTYTMRAWITADGADVVIEAPVEVIAP